MTHGTDQLLLVEDDESLRRILARHLRAIGYPVEEAASAEDALERLGEGLRPALVLLDLNLPGGTGWDVLREPALAAAGSPPVVITSRDDGQPEAAHRVPRRRLPAQALPARDARRDRRAAPRPGGTALHAMNDLQILLILIAVIAVLWAYLELVDRVRE